MCAEIGIAGEEFMEQIDIFSERIRWLAIATGLASALALFPILFLLYPAILIVGGIIQPRFPSMGKWFVWAGAAELLVVLITYDVHVLFPHPLSQPPYMSLMVSVSTILIIWCSTELIADGLNRLRAHRSMPRAEPPPVGWGAWVVAVLLNFVVGWSGYGLIGWYLQPRNPRLPDTGLYTFCMLLVTAVIVIAFDVSLAKRVIELKHARARESS